MAVTPSGDAIPRTPANVAALVGLADASPELADFAGRWTLDTGAVGSRSPYLTTHTADGRVILKINVSDVEVAWASAVADLDGGLAPRVYDAGTFAGTDVRWLLQERVAGSVSTTRAGNRSMMDAA